MKPTVGRIVHWYPPGLALQPIAAIVTAVQTETDKIWCTAFLPSINPYTVSEVPFSETPKSGFWSWPPKN